MAAAVADYTPAQPVKRKIGRTGKSLTIKLKPTADILKWAAANKKSEMRRRGRLVVGFALADKDLRRNAEKKLKDKHLDMIIANTPDAIGSDKSTVHIKTPCSGWITNANIDKAISALKIIRMIENL
jgi:phosphopantothenoylcysteine synthetase/decarboxylase